MNSINNMDVFGCHPHDDRNNHSSMRPIAEATSADAKARIVECLSLGVPESEIRIVRNHRSGEESVLVSKAGMIMVAKRSPLGGVEAAARVQEAIKDTGYSLTIDEELDIVSSGGSGAL